MLRQICRQKEEFQLTEACEDVFCWWKDEISKNIILPYFNPKSLMILQTDTSKKGLGAVLLQNSTPVMFTSRALTGAEKNYQNLDQECLATIWGMEKFHYFLYGKQFNLEIDQKPLVAIYKKHIVEISPRIQWLVFWPRISDDIWEAVERCGTCQASSRAAKPLGSASEVPPHPWYTLGTNLLYWNKIDFLMIGEYFTKFIIVWRLPNSSRIWTTIHAEKWQWTMLQFQGVPGVPWVLSSAPHHEQPTSSTEQWICWGSSGHHKAVDGKKPSKTENHGTMGCCNIKLLQFPVPSHHC